MRSRVVEGAQDSTRRKSLRDVRTCSLAYSCSENFLQRKRSSTPGAPSTTVRSLRELQWSPSPAIAGAESGGASRDASHRRLRNRLANDRTFSLFASFYWLFPIFSYSPFVISSLKKLRGRSADRRHCPVTAPRRRALPLVGARGAGAPYGARSPTGAPPRFLHRRTNATAQPQAVLPGTRLRNGRYPSPPVPVQRASRRPVVVPAGRLPRAARERVTKPPAGTALTPFRGSSRETPSHERASFRN